MNFRKSLSENVWVSINRSFGPAKRLESSLVPRCGFPLISGLVTKACEEESDHLKTVLKDRGLANKLQRDS